MRIFKRSLVLELALSGLPTSMKLVTDGAARRAPAEMSALYAAIRSVTGRRRIMST